MTLQEADAARLRKLHDACVTAALRYAEAAAKGNSVTAKSDRLDAAEEKFRAALAKLAER